jgi:hypothetical protein
VRLAGLVFVLVPPLFAALGGADASVELFDPLGEGSDVGDVAIELTPASRTSQVATGGVGGSAGDDGMPAAASLSRWARRAELLRC